jgi:hypothetical protein
LDPATEVYPEQVPPGLIRDVEHPAEPLLRRGWRLLADFAHGSLGVGEGAFDIIDSSQRISVSLSRWK